MALIRYGIVGRVNDFQPNASKDLLGQPRGLVNTDYSSGSPTYCSASDFAAVCEPVR
jgi:hypothetical protein